MNTIRTIQKRSHQSEAFSAKIAPSNLMPLIIKKYSLYPLNSKQFRKHKLEYMHVKELIKKTEEIFEKSFKRAAVQQQSLQGLRLLDFAPQVQNLPVCTTDCSEKFFIFAKISHTLSGENFLFQRQILHLCFIRCGIYFFQKSL